MALLVKENKALLTLEKAFQEYYVVVLGKDLYIDSTKSVEDRLLFLATELSV